MKSYFRKGDNIITIDAKDLISGIYFYKITTSETSETRKMIILK